MMQRRHFVLIAQALRDALDNATEQAERAGAVKAIESVTAACAGSNARFCENTFLRACGL
jgi:hypothetical protein